MTVIIELCGGPAEGQIVELRERPIQWRVPVPCPYPRFWELDREPYDVVVYLDTNICTQEGHILYATAELFDQLRIDQVAGEGGPSWAMPAEMSGKKEYPLDAIKREDTKRLIAQIDEVTDAGA